MGIYIIYTVYMYTHKICIIYEIHIHVIYTDTLYACACMYIIYTYALNTNTCSYIIYTYANSVDIQLSHKTGKTPAFLA